MSKSIPFAISFFVIKIKCILELTFFSKISLYEVLRYIAETKNNFSTPLSFSVENYGSVSLIEGKWLERYLNEGKSEMMCV